MMKKEEKKIKVKTLLVGVGTLLAAGCGFYCGYLLGRKDGVKLAQAGLMNAITAGVNDEVNI